MNGAFDFSAVPTNQLRAETIRRASEVGEVNDRAWEALTAGCFLLWPPSLIRWHRAIKVCKAFTHEMRARTAELRVRRDD